MADKLEFSEKLVYDYFKQHKLHKSGADAVIQMVENIKSLDPLLYSKLTHQKNIRIK